MLERKEDLETYNYVKRLYMTLRAKLEFERRDFNPNKYKWVLGYKIIDKFLFEVVGLIDPVACKTLFGITIACNYENPECIQLFEDITDRVNLPHKEEDDDCIKMLREVGKDIHKKYTEILKEGAEE